MNLYTTSVLAAAMLSAASASCVAFDTALGGGNTKQIKSAHAALKAADVDVACMTQLLTRYATVPERAKFLKDYPNVLARAAKNKVPLSEFPSDLFVLLSDKAITPFFKEAPLLQCSTITQYDFDLWNHIMKKKKLAAAITPACFAQIPNLELHNAGNGLKKEHVKNLPAKVFSMREDELNPEYFTGITAEQLKHFQSHKDLVDDQCSAQWVALEAIKEKLLSDVSARCFQNWVINRGVRQLSMKAAGHIKLDHLNKAGIELYPRLESAFLDDGDKKAWRKADLAVIDKIATNVPGCFHLTVDGVRPEMKVTGEAFAMMKPAVQGQVLAKVKVLPDDLFKHFTDAQLAAITYDDNKGKSCAGLACLKFIREHKNVAAIMSHIDAFVCEGKEFGYFADKEKKMVGQYMSRACFKELDVDYDDVEHNIREVHENVLRFLDVSEVKRLFVSEDQGTNWLDLASEYNEDKAKNRVWPGLLRNPKICARLVSLGTFKKLIKKNLSGALDGFSSECLRVLPEFDQLPAEYVALIGDQIYSAFTKADASKIDHAKSSAVQIGNASARVETAADHYGATLTAEQVKGFAPDLFSVMNAGYFESMTPDAYAAISKDQLALVAPEKLTRVPAASFTAMADDVKKSLTAEQIAFVGSHGGPKSEPEREMLLALGAVAGGFNEHQSKAFKARLALSESGAVGLAGTSLMALVASVAIIFPLL